jgi:5-methylcytosine-specific restriction endonuclease McrA
MKTNKPKKLPNLDGWVTVKLRRASLMWPGRTKAMQAARVDRGLYECAMCKGRFRKGEYHLDHIDSVVPIDGGNRRKDNPARVDFNMYIDRLFVGPEQYQVLCTQCHSSKTALEDSMRTYYKNEKKESLGKKLIKSLKEAVDAEIKNGKKK